VGFAHCFLYHLDRDEPLGHFVEKVAIELRNPGINRFNAGKDMIVKSPIEHPVGATVLS